MEAYSYIKRKSIISDPNSLIDWGKITHSNLQENRKSFKSSRNDTPTKIAFIREFLDFFFIGESLKLHDLDEKQRVIVIRITGDLSDNQFFMFYTFFKKRISWSDYKDGISCHKYKKQIYSDGYSLHYMLDFGCRGDMIALVDNCDMWLGHDYSLTGNMISFKDIPNQNNVISFIYKTGVNLNEKFSSKMFDSMIKIVFDNVVDFLYIFTQARAKDFITNNRCVKVLNRCSFLSNKDICIVYLMIEKKKDIFEVSKIMRETPLEISTRFEVSLNKIVDNQGFFDCNPYMNSKHRCVKYLYIRGFSQRDIASIIETTPGDISMIISRVIKKTTNK